MFRRFDFNAKHSVWKRLYNSTIDLKWEYSCSNERYIEGNHNQNATCITSSLGVFFFGGPPPDDRPGRSAKNKAVGGLLPTTIFEERCDTKRQLEGSLKLSHTAIKKIETDNF